MKKTFLLLMLSIISLSVISAKETKVAFKKISPNAARKIAKQEGKLYFIDFTASWCAPCQNMNQTTFMDERLAGYMKKNYVAVKVDIDDFDGFVWKNEYNIKVLPTMLVIDANGKVLKRYEQAMGGTLLLNELKKYEKYKKAPTAISPDPWKPAPKPNVKPSKPKPAPSIPKIASGGGLYRFNVSRQASKGFGVQIGVFAEYGNVLTEVEKLQAKFDEPILVNINILRGKTVYKIIIGAFNTRNKAINFRKNVVRKRGTDGIIKDLSTMK